MCTNPLSFIVNFVPVCVPSGILYVVFVPSTSGISSSAPSVACVNVIGMSQYTLSSCLVNILCLFSLTITYMSPFSPPFFPGSPSPFKTTV